MDYWDAHYRGFYGESSTSHFHWGVPDPGCRVTGPVFGHALANQSGAEIAFGDYPSSSEATTTIVSYDHGYYFTTAC